MTRIASGRLRGLSRDGIRFFGGIPYAAPPVGELRFAAPAPPEPWDGVRDATEFAQPSLQQDILGRGLVGAEDCLYLNVYAPEEPGPHPVLVWIHGGGGVTGSPNEYDATRFAQHGVVVVTVAYRLGVLGLLYLPEAFPDTNFALADQVAALRWVQANIEALGGDPGQVTLAGESNGGRMVGNLLAAPDGLFQQAIIQSGTGVGTLVHEPEAARRVAAEILAELELTDPAALREIDARRIVEAQQRYSARAESLVPYRVVMEPPLAAVAAGSAANVRLLIGTNHDEMDLFRKLGQVKGDEDDRARTATDWWLPAIRFAEAQHAAGGQVWMYRLDWRAFPPGQGMGAAHALDLPLVFDDLDNPYYRLFLGRDTGRARGIAATMHDAWVRFVCGEPAWPAYEPGNRTTMLFDEPARIADDPDSKERLLRS
ncbi:carboxylesterase/lipase family protein [Amycolatopsis sp.]|uniref:carboxylesterase/lipase family protein n=1 Tax=Amycolatopsis sp. TaxID=37632 RepID=UPI002B973225|nr:carboxylesterase family protein [Amycolatopsis sp.]HVV12494.1 carboxylesterase family protein [Amycolatopsis sp.]